MRARLGQWAVAGVLSALFVAPALGGGGETTTVSPVTVRPLAPVPKVGDGAPYFTGDEIATARANAVVAEKAGRALLRGSGDDERFDFHGFGADPMVPARALCRTYQRAAHALVEATDVLDSATAAAIQARAALTKGEVGQESVDATELIRQTASRAFIFARNEALESDNRVMDFLELWTRGKGEPTREVMPIWVQETNRRSEVRRTNGGVYTPLEFNGLRLERVTVRQIPFPEGAVVRVAGRIVNIRQNTATVPYLRLTPLDKGGFPMRELEKQISGPKGTKVRSNSAFSFNYDLKPPPEGAVAFRVNFASEWRPGVMDPRSCGDLDPDAALGGGERGSAAEAAAATQAGAAEAAALGGAQTGVTVGGGGAP